MLIIGSRALVHHFPQLDRKPVDWDYICTFEEFQAWSRKNKDNLIRCVPTSGDKFHARDKQGMNYEFEIAWPGSTAESLLGYELGNDAGDGNEYFCSDESLLALKLSHRYLKNSPHFLKTMRDIQFLRTQCELSYWLMNWLPKREEATYVYKHPKLDVTSKEFFTGDGVEYVYEHDSIHLAVALDNVVVWGQPCPDNKPGCLVAHGKRVLTPAYTRYMKDGSEVMTSKAKFYSVSQEIRIAGVYEESCVLALERSQIPHGEREDGPTARWSFEMALMKVCTSITSGWFREFAWEHYDDVMALYNKQGETDYLDRFNRYKSVLIPYKGDYK